MRRTRRPLSLAVATLLVGGLAVTAPGAASAADPVGLADFEGGLPPGWFVFNGGASTVAPTVLTVSDTDAAARPGQVGDNNVLSLTYDVGDFGGVGQDLVSGLGGPQDWSATGGFSFWFYGTNSGLSYQAEIADNRSDPSTDTSERFDYTFTDDTSGWRQISIPWADFSRATDFQPGGAPDDGLTLTEVYSWAIVLPNGADTVYVDDVVVDPLTPDVIDDFENGLPFGESDPNGELLGFYTFQGDGSVAIATESTPPAPELPAVGAPNNALKMDVDVASFAGYIHAFENEAVDTWVTQDWSTREGIAFWMYGLNSGTQMFIDILDNRNPGSTTDDAERFTVPFVDDFTGWQLLEFPFTDFVRKEIGNGAPNDGLGLFEMHGYALGTLGTGGARTFYFDEVNVYGVAEPPALAVNFSMQNTFIEEGTTGQVGVKLNRPMGPDDPAEVSIDFATERSIAIPFEEYTPTSGTLTFTNGGPSELFFDVETFDDTKFEGDEQVVIRLTNPVDVERGALFQGSVLIDDTDEFDAKLLDDFEQGAFLWDTEGLVTVDSQRVESSDADARPEQDPVENIGVTGATPGNKKTFDDAEQAVRELEQSGGSQAEIDQIVAASAALATAAVEVAEQNGGDERRLAMAERRIAEAEAAVEAGRDSKAVQSYRKAWQEATKALRALERDGEVVSAGSIVRDFPLGQDWTGTESLDFWYRGTGSGDPVTVTLKDNRAPDPGPSGWELAWADEFDAAAGTPPNPANWAYEIGDTTPDGKNGWGNEELQYYTDDPANAQTDGNGNLVITLSEADGSQECYYGPCEFESARLITQNKAEFAYGKIESRIQVPTGGDGLWPAFWSLGTDITYNPWPGAGEIDIMEYVSRIPNEIFGTIHGPGYNGGNAFGNIYDFGERVDQGYHTFTVEWEPNLITWYVDGIQYHQAEPSDVPGPWVFEKPFFLLLNFAIGGNFGGAIDPDNTYPQEYLVDYVRVYQGPDSAERFETTFTDSSSEWQQVSIPLSEFSRSAEQPDGAPDDGLGLDEVWGYSLTLPSSSVGSQLDLVQRTPFPPPTEVVVTNTNDSGEGSLREALALVADDGTVTFDPALAGQTIVLTSGQLAIDSSVTVDASAVAPLTISGNDASRVVQVAAGAEVAMNDLVIRDGAAAPQGGGILNNGDLSLERVVVTDNTENSAAPANFANGGGGIYNGDGATLNLTDSTVSNNTTVAQPGGGVYGFFNSTLTITNSTISGNVAADVAGGLRTLGDATIVGSTISGNTSTAWHGGGIFATDGTVVIEDTSIVDNVAVPGGTAGGIMVATFGAPVLVTLENSVLTGNVSKNCQVEGDPAVAVLTLVGGNTIDDGSCGTP